MAEFTSNFQSFRPSFPFFDIDHMELVNQFKGVNTNVLDNSILNMHNLMSDTFLGSSESGFPGNLEENFPGLLHYYVNHNEAPVSLPISPEESETHQGNKKRKATESSTPAVSESGNKTKPKSPGGRSKRVKRNATENENSGEVVHVRARRGQATDHHSLAERVRRGKINEKLRCLQNIVPGCYKSMGMAIMLDEIINYVQSLQHQVEFLSMKLTAASTLYDFSSQTDVLERKQRLRASETKELAKYGREGCEGVS